MSWSERRATLESMAPRDAVRLIFRKAIYRRVSIGRFGTLAGSSEMPEPELAFPIEFWTEEAFGRVLGTNPYLTADDIERFRHQESVCIVVLDGDRIAASSWMTRGEVFVSELQQVLSLDQSEHFSCRSYVDPDYRGHALLSHMIHAYSIRRRPDDEVWGVQYLWNTAAVRSTERLGWRHSGTFWTLHLFGVKLSHSRRFAPRDRITN